MLGDNVLETQKRYKEKHKEKMLAYQKDYREKNRDEINEKQRESRSIASEAEIKQIQGAKL